MILGTCPYEGCDEPLMIGVADGQELPRVLPHECEGCHRRIWSYLSRVDPWSMTDEDFRKHYDVDEITKHITPKTTTPTP